MARIAIALLLLSHSAAGAWRRVADLPFALSDFTATVVPNFGEVEGRGRIVIVCVESNVIVGGCDEDQVAEDEWTFCPSISKKVLLYDYAADAWSRGLDAPRERYRHAAATDGRKLYVLGGRDVAENLVPQTDVYDTDTGRWATIAAEVPRSDLGAIWNDAGDLGLLGPHIFVAGGYNADYSVAFTDTLKINPETGEITPGANLLVGRGDFGFVSTGANARAYAVGGFNSDDFCTPLSSVETLDLNSNWPDFAESKPLLVAVWKSKFYGAFVLNHRVVLHAIDATPARWRGDAGSSPLDRARLVGRADKAVAYGEDALFAVGGERNPQCSGSAPQDDVEKLGAVWKSNFGRPIDAMLSPLGVHPESDGWSVISDLPDERFRNAAVVVEGWLYIFGGQDEATQNCLSNSACYPVRETAWRLWVGEGADPTPDENTGGGGKKGGGHPRKKRESRITWAVIFAVIALVIILVAICLFLKCRKAQQEARARGSTNWQAPPPSVELGKPEPAPGHWRPADEMQTQVPV